MTAGVLGLALGLGLSAAVFLVANASFTPQPAPVAVPQSQPAGYDVGGLAEQWQLQLMFSTSVEPTSAASAGSHLGRLVSVDGDQVVVDWLGYDGSRVRNRSPFQQTVILSPMAVALEQRQIGRGYNGATEGPAVVSGADRASVLVPATIAHLPRIAQGDWWILIDSNGLVLQLVEAARAPSP